MKFDNIQKTENKVLSRFEVSATLKYEGATPKNDDVKQALASQLGVDAALCVVKHIYTRFGECAADVLLYTYQDAKSMSQSEFVKKAKKEAAPAKEAADKGAKK